MESKTYSDVLEEIKADFEEAQDEIDEKVSMFDDYEEEENKEYLKKMMKSLNMHSDSKDYVKVAVYRARQEGWDCTHKYFELARTMYETDLLKKRFKQLEKDYDYDDMKPDIYRKRVSATNKAHRDKCIDILHDEIMKHKNKKVRNQAKRRLRKRLEECKEDRNTRSFYEVYYRERWKTNVAEFEESIIKRHQNLIDSGAVLKVYVPPDTTEKDALYAELLRQNYGS